MTDKRTAHDQNGPYGLHLPSLTIKGFRGFKEMHLPEFGQVTLLAGENGVGKSTVLEAAQLYASSGHPGVIADILNNREDIYVGENEDEDYSYFPNHGRLFFGYNGPRMGDVIEIGFAGAEKALNIELSLFEIKDLDDLHPHLLSTLTDYDMRCLAISSNSNRKIMGKFPFFHSEGKRLTGRIPPVRGGSWTRPWQLHREMYRGWKAEDNGVRRIPYERLGPGLLSNERIVSRYEAVQLTSNEETILEVLRFIKPNIERLASEGSLRYGHPRMVAKLKDVGSPVPLKSMGDGIVRLLGLAVILVNTKNGLLLIDEVENGIHHTLFPKLWKFVMRTAQKNNVQVIAATHSWDCFEGFAQVAYEMEDVKGRVIRIDRDGEETWAVPYPREVALAAVKSDIEVR